MIRHIPLYTFYINELETHRQNLITVLGCYISLEFDRFPYNSCALIELLEKIYLHPRLNHKSFLTE